MFGLGLWEIGIILIVALLLLGPRRLPDLAQGVGRGLREFRQAIREDRGLD
jgi:TatA/E family protein of Tat protein translocase